MMKKTCMMLVAAGFIAAGTNAQTKGITIVKGSYEKDVKRPVVLFAVKEGDKRVYATTDLDAQNGYAFAIADCKEGFYYLGDTLKREFTRIYLKPNDLLTVNIENKGKAKLVNGSAENKLLFKWADMSYIISKPTVSMGDTSTYKSFFPNLHVLLPQAEVFKSKIKTPNATFNQLMHTTVDFDMQRWALRFLMIPHSEHPEVSQYPAYYKEIIAKNKLGSAEILQIGEAADYVGLYVNYNSVLAFKLQKKDSMPKISATERLNKSIALIPNDTLKGLYLANTFYQYRTYEGLTEAMEPNQQYLVTPAMKEKYFFALKSVNTFRKGTPAFNFKYPDTNGKTVSLADLKGKVVVVDIWATWCGPCKKELPYLKQLEEEMHDNPNVAFVSISVDEEKDRDKWGAFVKDQSLGGIQLYGKGWSDIVKFYNVTGIPRFMVFDPKGNIVSVDAPRPSTPDLKKMIESSLL